MIIKPDGHVVQLGMCEEQVLRVPFDKHRMFENGLDTVTGEFSGTDDLIGISGDKSERMPERGELPVDELLQHFGAEMKGPGMVGQTVDNFSRD